MDGWMDGWIDIILDKFYPNGGEQNLDLSLVGLSQGRQKESQWLQCLPTTYHVTGSVGAP